MALDQVLMHELVLNRVHQAIKFDQSTWLVPYITLSIQLRTRAKNNFEKDFFKLMKNSMFRKSQEGDEAELQIRNHLQ